MCLTNIYYIIEYTDSLERNENHASRNGRIQGAFEQLERSQKTIDGYLGELLFFQKWVEERLNGPVNIEDITV